MIRWQQSALAFSALPELGKRLLSPEPAIVFARDGSRVLWANPAGGRSLGTAHLGRIAGRSLAEDDPLRRAVASLGRALPEEGTLSRLRLTRDVLALPVLCRCRPVRAGVERGILALIMAAPGARPDAAALASFFTDGGTVAAIIDAMGAVVAEGARGAAEAIDASTPAAELEDGQRELRLYLLEREEEPAPRTGAPRMPASLDGPGLSTIAPLRAAPVEVRVAARPEARPRADAADTPEATARPPLREPPPQNAAPEAPAVAPIRPASDGEISPRRQQPAPPVPRQVSAGRVPQGLSRRPVRFLWQTDAADRFLFISPGLAQVVGRSAEVVGERWQEAEARLRLDPGGRILAALRRRDTWSGLTAWWPVEGSNVRVPVELTALPVFGADQSFQGYRGFGILKPAEALMPAAFEARFGPDGIVAEPQPPYEESVAPNVVPIRADIERMAESARLTAQERNAFEEIAASLRERIVDGFAARSAGETDDVLPPADEALEVEGAAEAEAEDEPQAEPVLAPVPHREAKAVPPVPAARSPAPEEDRGGSLLAKQLSEARRRLGEMTAILDTATDGVIVVDANGMIESANASAEALFGLESHEMVGRPLADLLTPDSRKSALDYLSGLRDSGVASLLNEGREVEAMAGAGSIPLFMTMGQISSEEGRRFCAVLRDITHWKRIEAELVAARRAAEQASSQKSDFLGRVSNEIRAPLGTIIGLAETMIEERHGPISNERYRESLRDIRTAGEQVVNLVNDLLDISRIEAGRLTLDFSAVPLNEIVREAIATVQPQANRARVVLRSSLSQEVPAIVGDERTFRQIMLSLLSNAVRHAGPGGQAIISTSLSETGEALVRIRDTGPGMSEEEVARALEPFRDLSIATLADRAGTGLALPLTKALVEANRAALSIKSAQGEGTVLTVTIPPTRVLSE